MNNALGVSGIEGISDLNRQVHKPLRLKRPTEDGFPQGPAFQVLHDNERTALESSDFMDRTDVWMIKRGSCSRLSAESFERLEIFSQFIGKELQSDKTAKFGILGLIDDAHPSAPEFLEDAVVRDGLADKLRGASHWRE